MVAGVCEERSCGLGGSFHVRCQYAGRLYRFTSWKNGLRVICCASMFQPGYKFSASSTTTTLSQLLRPNWLTGIMMDVLVITFYKFGDMSGFHNYHGLNDRFGSGNFYKCDEPNVDDSLLTCRLEGLGNLTLQWGFRAAVHSSIYFR